MKITPTLEGGLRVDFEDDYDWHVLLGITHDAVSCDEKLASRLADLIKDGQIARDWQEYIVPELEQGFQSDLAKVAAALAAARTASGGSAGSLWIKRDDAFHWYSALNQARLALHHLFEQRQKGEKPASGQKTPVRGAQIRSQFYCAFQSLLLDHAMK